MRMSLPNKTTTRTGDWLQWFADRERELLKRIDDLSSERESYRTLLQVALGQLEQMTRQLARARRAVRARTRRARAKT